MTPLRPPADPTTAALVRAAQASQRSRLTRRSILTGGLLGGAALAAAGCAPPPPPAGGATQVDLPTDVSAKEKTLAWSNWTAYLDYDEDTKKFPTLQAFMKKTGLEVDYQQDIEDNDTFYAKVGPQLRAEQSIERDLFTLTDWMANRVIRDQLCQPLSLMDLPHVVTNLRPALKEVSFDPGRRYSVTWQSGFAGIGYNKKKVGKELRSLEDLWAPELKGKVVVLSEFRDTLGLVMQSQGVDIEGDWGKEQFEASVAFIESKIADGHIRKVKGNSYLEDLTSGNAVAGITWSGDIFVLAADTGDESWTFAIPESGGTLWSDNLMIPSTSTHQASAHELIDYYYQPEVAAEVAAYVNYVCPVEGAQEAMEKIDPDLAQSDLIFPTESYIKDKKIQGFRALGSEEDIEYSDIWSSRVMSA